MFDAALLYALGVDSSLDFSEGRRIMSVRFESEIHNGFLSSQIRMADNEKGKIFFADVAMDGSLYFVIADEDNPEFQMIDMWSFPDIAGKGIVVGRYDSYEDNIQFKVPYGNGEGQTRTFWVANVTTNRAPELLEGNIFELKEAKVDASDFDIDILELPNILRDIVEEVRNRRK